jgi:hypothetical protein
METVMNARFVTIAAAAVALSTSAFAEPPKAAKAPQPTPPQSHSSPVVLASADQVVSPAPTSNQASPAPKRRAMRVTTCRCGDPQAQQEEQQ